MNDFFKESEFRACSPSCEKSDMNPDFLRKLNEARALAGVPFVLNSAFRSSAWDTARGRSGRGYHTVGRAVDVACIDGRSRARVVCACLSVGLSCGISKNFVHVDNRENQTVFLYN